MHSIFSTKKYLYLAITVVALLFSTFADSISAASLTNPKFNSEELHRMLQQDIERYNIPAASLSVGVMGDRIINVNVGLSDIEKNKKITPGQLFIIGSVSKSFLVAVVLDLIQQGKITLNDTLGQLSEPGTVLQTILDQYPPLKSISLKQLLTHTSGLGDSINTKGFAKLFASQPMADWSSSELISFGMMSDVTKSNLASLGKSHKYFYTNMNYYLVSLAVSSITHESACSLIQHEIDRAGLKNTYIPCTTGSVYPKSVLARLADGYVTPTQGGWSNTFMEVFSRYPKVMLPGVHPVIGYNITPLAVNMSHWDFPAGGIVSSSDDLVRWYEALFSGKLVDKKILKEMYSWVPMGDGGYYGLAIKKQYLKQYKTDMYFHGGDQLAYVTNVLYLKRFNLIIALTTSSDNDYTDYIDKGIILDILQVLLNSPGVDAVK